MSLVDLISPEMYHLENHSKEEFEKIFSTQWIFAAMEDDLEENNSFITLDIFGYPIVLQNFKGEIKAFENICPHRFNKIQTESFGKRPFTCKYHSWSFNSDGLPNKKPLMQYFDVDSEEFNSICLKKIQLQKIGKFIFITLTQNPKPISEYLGFFYDKLLEISNAINSRFYFDDDAQNINWKIIIENVIEAYHCPSIHQETLYGMGFCDLPETSQEYFKGHSVADYPKNNSAEPINKLLKYLDNRVFKHATFRHFFVFPNLLISSTEGTNIYIGNILPKKANQSVLRKRFYDVKFIGEFEPKKAIHKAFLEIAKTSINTILSEDKVILEQIQKNLIFTDRKYILGSQEQRLVNFHKHYNQLIK